MDVVVGLSVAWLLVTRGFRLFLMPAQFGKHQEPLEATDFGAWLVFHLAPVLVVCGRAAGWW